MKKVVDHHYIKGKKKALPSGKAIKIALHYRKGLLAHKPLRVLVKIRVSSRYLQPQNSISVMQRSFHFAPLIKLP